MSKVMSYDKYLQVQADKHVPYFFSLVQPPHLLYYLGVRHSFNTNDPQYPVIRNHWHNFLNEADANNSLVYIEAGQRITLRENESQAIELNGESGLMIYLAHKANIPVECPEPDKLTEFHALKELFNPDEILFYYTARVVAQYFRLINPPSLEKYVQKYIERDKKIFGQPAAHWSWNHFKELAKQYESPGFDKSSERFWKDISNPTIQGNIINEVTRTSSRLRDEHIANEIIKQFKSGKSLFITYGSSHAVMQEPYIKAQLKISK